MNPDRNRGGMTVDALMQTGLIVSTAIPVVAFALLGFASLQLDHTTLVLVIVFCAIIVLLGVLIVNYFVQRRIKDRIQDLVSVSRDYVGGDRAARAVVNGDDDFAMLAMSINGLLENSVGGASLGGFSATGSDAAALQAQIEKLLQEVSAVGDGDLRVQAEVTPDTLGVLADSFNYMIEELAKVVGRVQSTAVQVTNSTRRILDRSAELAQASEAQVAQISQTTESVEALAVFIQNVAHNAQLSAQVAQEALRSAISGQQSVSQTIEGMMLIRENVQETAKKIKRLGERSNEIGEIVRIIEDIADQTNLLALNAAIQSAMAGEHGRGFAVVADEIRLLAERSTESTKRIATLVKSIQGDTYEAVVAMEDSTQEVVKGSQLADEAGRSLNSIHSAVERQAQMIEDIARAANQQTSVSEAVAVAMSQISEITRQSDVGTQEAAVSVSYLAELAEQLRASVATFRLPDRGNEMADAFSSMTAVSEISDPNPGQLYAAGAGQGMQGMQGMDNGWNQSFSSNFPPLPEPGNSGSLVALTSQSAQFNFNQQQQDYGQMNFGNQGMFDPNGFNGKQGPSQPDFGNQPAYNEQYFGNQPTFGDFGGFEGHSDFGGNGFGAQSFGAPNMGNAGGQNQMYNPNTNQPQSPQMMNSALLPPPQQPGQNPAQRAWRQNGYQQNSGGQNPFNQDQMPFQNNG
jgi:twitching motility protein PilJ